MKYRLSVNDRLKDLRTNKHMRLEDLSNETGIPKASLGNYEQENYPVPHPIILQLADYYGVSTDFLLGITDNPATAMTPVSALHLSDVAIEKLLKDETNSRLISEIIENDHFQQFLIDAEIYIDGYVEQSIDDYNTLMRFARQKVSGQTASATDVTSETLNHAKVAQQEYFSQLFSNELIQILDEIKEKHSKDSDTSDGAYTSEQYEQIFQTIMDHRSGPLNGLGAGILEALRIKKSEKNLQDMDRLIEEDQPEEAAVTDLLGQSPIIEPDARKRRKR